MIITVECEKIGLSQCHNLTKLFEKDHDGLCEIGWVCSVEPRKRNIVSFENYVQREWKNHEMFCETGCVAMFESCLRKGDL